MKNVKILYIILIVTLLVGVGCAPVSTPKVEEAPVQEAPAEVKPVVYASIYPMYDFARKIGKDKIDLRLIIPPGAEPHGWEPTAKMMMELEKADVLIYNGAQIEMWIDKVLGSLSNESMIVVEATEGIELLKYSEDGHDHGHEDEGKAKDAHGEYDPHVWLDPIKAIEQANIIKDALIKADEENKEFYENNFNEFAGKLTALDIKFEESLKNRKRDQIVVAHGAFGYMAARYGLEQISISGLSPQEEPSAAKLAELTKKIKEYDIRYIFFETLTSPKLSEMLAIETGASTAVLNPLDGLTAEDIKAGKDYLSIMEENLDVLIKALGE